MKKISLRAKRVVLIRTVLPVPPVVIIPARLAQQVCTPRELLPLEQLLVLQFAQPEHTSVDLPVLRVGPMHTVLLVLPVVTILVPLVQQARMLREQLLVLCVEKESTMI